MQNKTPDNKGGFYFTSGNTHSVTSGAVAEAFGTWETIYSATGIIIKGKIINGDALIKVSE